MIFSPWDTSGDVASWGGLACLIASFSYAIGYVYMDRYLARRGTDPLGLSASQLLAAAALMALALPFAHGFAPPELHADAVAAIVVLGVFGTGTAYVLNYWLIAREGTAASVVIYLLPVVAVILGAIVLAEPITWPVLVGMTIVLAGVALTRRRSPAQEPSTAE